MKIKLIRYYKLVLEAIYETRYLLTPLVGLEVLFFAFWRLSNKALSDFGLNAFTTVFGNILTVLVVDRLIKHQEQLRSLPYQVAAFEDVRVLITKIIFFWVEAFYETIPRPSPTTVNELFAEDVISEIESNLDLNSAPRVTPPTNWWSYFVTEQREFLTTAERILQRHAGQLAPKAYSYVHQFVSVSFDPTMMLTMRQPDLQAKFPRPSLLKNYWFRNKELLSVLLKLHQWCLTAEEALHRRGVVTASPVPKALSIRHPSNPPMSKMKPDILAKQLANLAEFRRLHEYIDPHGNYDKKQ